MSDGLDSFARDVLPIGQTEPGDEVTVTVRTIPEKFEHPDFGEGIKFDADLTDSTCDFTDDEGDVLCEPGDEVQVRSHSKRLARALVDARDTKLNGDLLGESVTVRKIEAGDFPSYEVEPATE